MELSHVAYWLDGVIAGCLAICTAALFLIAYLRCRR